MSGPLRRARANVTEIVSVLVTATWLAALFTGQGWWLPAMLVGYVAVVPLTALLFGDRDAIEEWWDDGPRAPDGPAESGVEADEDPVETLKRRYAEGELTDEEFERKLERLLETERIDRPGGDRTAQERERERERG